MDSIIADDPSRSMMQSVMGATQIRKEAASGPGSDEAKMLQLISKLKDERDQNR